MLIETPCIFQGGNHVFWDTLYISGRGSCFLGHPVYFRGGSCLLGHPVYFREGILFIGTPCIFQRGDHSYWDTLLFQHNISEKDHSYWDTPYILEKDHSFWDTLYISGRGSCLLGHPVYFKEGIIVIGTPCIFQREDHVYWDTLYISERG